MDVDIADGLKLIISNIESLEKIIGVVNGRYKELAPHISLLMRLPHALEPNPRALGSFGQRG
jgi:hypothetical protein